MNKLRGKRVLVTVPELKKSAVELSAKDEEMIMMEAMKKWQSLEIYQVGDDVVDLKPGDKVYVQTYALESGEKIEVDGKMRILIPDTAIAIVW
jgi:DNA-binding transcriptional regulator/RsmH inhibitor MraZ